MNLKPVQPEELKRLLNNGIISFAFKKLGGDLRTAIGTTQLSSIPIDKHPTGRGESSPLVVAYFDKEKKEWRSVSVTKEIFIQNI